MMRNKDSPLTELRLRPSPEPAPRDVGSESRTIVIRHGSTWQPVAFLCLSALLVAAILLGHEALSRIDRQNQETAVAMAQFERKMQELESGMAFDAKRRYLLLGMRDHILKVNPKVSLGDAY